MSADFHNSFSGWLVSKFAIKFALNIPPLLTNVATLPCEILMSEIAIIWNMYSDNNKSQGSVFKVWWSCFTTELSFCLLVKEFLNLIHFWQSYMQKGLIASHALFEVHCQAGQCMKNIEQGTYCNRQPIACNFAKY